ncbi:MAG: hypothetical protein QE493_06040 [Verrucomicrobiae bacterium]|jgi:hypothetical protein|nr:hypothetical protein [Verrucomicrobiae bacterium]
MIALSRFIPWVFFSFIIASSLKSQETTTPQVAPPVSEAIPSPSPEVTTPPPSRDAENKKEGSLPQETPAPQSDSSASLVPSTEPSPKASMDAPLSITPTDPSMLPPIDSSSTSSNNDTNAPVAPASNQVEQTSSSLAELPSTESVEKKKQELKVRYYEVRTEVEKEPELSALKEKADHATTDEEKRQALRAYYELLFARMKKKDPSISERCDLLEKAYLRRLEQVKLQPTIPLSLPPTSAK